MGAAEKQELRVAANEPQQWFTTAEAAVYLRTTSQGIRSRIARGSLRPDTFGRRGRSKCHMFSRATLDAHLGGHGE